MDQVNSLGRNDVEIVDYKTGKPKKDADAKKDLQLSLYALAAKEIFEWNPVRLVFHYLQNNQVQVTTRDAKQLDERSEEHTSELQSHLNLVCRLLLEKKKKKRSCLTTSTHNRCEPHP